MSSDKFKARLKIVMGHDSNSAFAKKCEISESAVRNYLKGQTTPDLDTLEKIAEVSGYSLAWLASGEGPMRLGDREYPTGEELKTGGTVGQQYGLADEMVELVRMLDRYGNKALVENLRERLQKLKQDTEG